MHSISIWLDFQVKSGELPVLDARVRAIIQFTGTVVNQDSTSSNNTIVLDLLDNGNADPDITKGDGVYSRYFGKYFRGAGTYSVTLSVDAMDGRAYSIRSSTNSKQFGNFHCFPYEYVWTCWLNFPIITTDAVECCGSVIRVPLERRELTGAFSRLVPGGVISAGSNQFGNAPSSPTNTTWQEPEALDVLPPSRITDLRVHVEPTTQRITFQWTAVGDDFDIGTGNYFVHNTMWNMSITFLRRFYLQLTLMSFDWRRTKLGSKYHRCSSKQKLFRHRLPDLLAIQWIWLWWISIVTTAGSMPLSGLSIAVVTADEFPTWSNFGCQARLPPPRLPRQSGRLLPCQSTMFHLSGSMVAAWALFTGPPSSPAFALLCSSSSWLFTLSWQPRGARTRSKTANLDHPSLPTSQRPSAALFTRLLRPRAFQRPIWPCRTRTKRSLANTSLELSPFTTVERFQFTGALLSCCKNTSVATVLAGRTSLLTTFQPPMTLRSSAEVITSTPEVPSTVEWCILTSRTSTRNPPPRPRHLRQTTGLIRWITKALHPWNRMAVTIRQLTTTIPSRVLPRSQNRRRSSATVLVDWCLICHFTALSHRWLPSARSATSLKSECNR